MIEACRLKKFCPPEEVTGRKLLVGSVITDASHGELSGAGKAATGSKGHLFRAAVAIGMKQTDQNRLRMQVDADDVSGGEFGSNVRHGASMSLWN